MINVQGDEPLIDPALVTKFAKVLAEDETTEMITAANVFGPEEDTANPNAVKVVLDRQRHALYFSRSAIPLCAQTGCGPPFTGTRGSTDTR